VDQSDIGLALIGAGGAGARGRDAHVTMHVLEGSKGDIEKQPKTSLEAFFDFYPEI